MSGCGGCEGEMTGNELGADADADPCVGADCADPDTGPPSDAIDAVDGADDDASGPDADTSDAEVCAPENRCASHCCADGELCLGDACVVPGSDCDHNRDCASGNICEPTLAKCIPDPGTVCEWRPPTQVFDPEVTHAWRDDASTPEPRAVGRELQERNPLR